MPYDLSRYIPLMKRVVEDQISNNLPKEVFPWVNEPTSDQLGIASNAPKMFRFTANGLTAPDPNHPHSLRTTRATWSNKSKQSGGNKAGGTSSGQEATDLRRNGSRVILFCLGGLTYSEIRSTYEMTKDSQREVFMGNIR